MTLMAAEAVAPAAESAGAAEGAAAGRSRASRYARDKARGAVRQAPGYYAGQARDLGGARVTPGDRSYQPAILAEFLVCVLIVALSPIARPKDAGGKGGPSPYHVDDLVQLVALGIFFFILALVSSGPRAGRIAAWFGGLVTLGILIAKNSSGDLSAVVTAVTSSAADRKAAAEAEQDAAGAANEAAQDVRQAAQGIVGKHQGTV